MSEQLVLHFETPPERYIDTDVAGSALQDWATLVRTVLATVDPALEIRIETVGVIPGSTRFPQLLRFLDTHVSYVRSAWDDYPHLKNMIIASAHTLFTSVVAAGVTLAMQPESQSVELSKADRELLKKIGDNRQVQEASQRFYRTIERDTAIQGIGVAKGWDARPTLIVPRAEFAVRSGLWERDDGDVQERSTTAVWNVILIRPALVSTPQPWQFMRDGLKFSAKMHDAIFLNAIREGTVPLTLQEGVTMQIEIEYTERLEGQIWQPVSNSRRVTRVLSPSTR